MKKYLLALLLCLGSIQAHAVVISCDPGATGTTQYPNVVCDSAGHLLTIGNTTASPANGAVTDCSGSITAGGTAQTAVAANANREYLFLQNLSAGDEYFNFTSAATTGGGSLKISAGSSFVMEAGFVSTDLVSIIGATTGQVFTCKYH